ncbi:hemerythrin domain-containing protein [Sedimenticola sp.]|uniref:hemerythrin domain-containing protein n=1 Tax=Sedimenticola sp. TaxID=1940285 RepID=UPI003D0BA903
MFSFFRKNRPPSETASTLTAPNTSIAYDTDLIETLEEDHQTLLAHYKQIEKNAIEQNFKAVQAELNRFKTLFHQHILLENVKLYVYLTHSLDPEGEPCKRARDMRREMRHIGKAVNQFIERYDIWPWEEEMESQFIGELEQIGNALVNRIETEEELLYPLYDIPSEST